MEAMGSLGFRLRKAECHYNYRLCRQRDFVQLLEYDVEGGVFEGTLAEVALCFFIDGPDTIVVLEFRRVTRGMADMVAQRLAQQEPISVTLTPAQLAAGAERVSATLEARL